MHDIAGDCTTATRADRGCSLASLPHCSLSALRAALTQSLNECQLAALHQQRLRAIESPPALEMACAQSGRSLGWLGRGPPEAKRSEAKATTKTNAAYNTIQNQTMSFGCINNVQQHSKASFEHGLGLRETVERGAAELNRLVVVCSQRRFAQVIVRKR